MPAGFSGGTGGCTVLRLVSAGTQKEETQEISMGGHADVVYACQNHQLGNLLPPVERTPPDD